MRPTLRPVVMTRPASEGRLEATEAAVMLLLLHPVYAKQCKGLLLGCVACALGWFLTKAGSTVRALVGTNGQLASRRDNLS